MAEVTAEVLPVRADDGHAWQLVACLPAQPHATLLWLPAMGVAAKHYRPFAEALAARGVATFVHEWRGNGSSTLRASRHQDWGYAELLGRDLPASEAAIAARLPELRRIAGGHSLGGQLACCRLAMAPQSAQRLWLVASGSPYWRAFPAPSRYGLPIVYRFLPWLADRCGLLPGRRLGFAGQEARGVIRDWARSALDGRYAAARSDPGHAHSGQADPGQADSGQADPGHTERAQTDPGRVDPEHGDPAVADPASTDLERALGRLETHIDAVVLRHDWLAPPSSLQFLLSKLGDSSARVAVLDDAALGGRADHFEWMKKPARVVDQLIG